jgi:tetratricopeptide (TPR) repeat protein
VKAEPRRNVPRRDLKEFFVEILQKAEKGEYRAALDDLNWILDVDPQDAIAYRHRGMIRGKQGELQGAIADLNQAIKLNSKDALAYRHRGQVRLKLADNHGAIADLNRALELNPEDASLYVIRGNIYRSMGNHLGALDDYNYALEINEDSPDAYFNRAIAYSKLEEMQAAIEDYQTAAKIYCDREDWQNYNQAIESLKQIQSITPQATPAPTQEFLRKRLLRLVGGYWELAERLLQGAREENPGMGEQWYLEKVIRDIERDRE